MEKHIISVIIPTKDFRQTKRMGNLLNDIYSQEVNADIEIQIATRASTIGKARNNGAKRAKGDIFVFLDDDVCLGHKKVFKNLIELLSSENIGICGASQLIPKNSNWFQRRFAKEIPHTEHPLVDKAKEVAMVGGGCCATRREVFLNIGGFNEQLLRGIDVEFCQRVKKNNYRVILAPHTWIYHPPPRNLIQIAFLNFRNGKATAFCDRYYPDLNFDVGTDDIIYSLKRVSKKYRLLRYFKSIIKSIIFFRLISLVAKIVYPIGYFSERFRISMRKKI